jgi:5'-3' exonuclease
MDHTKPILFFDCSYVIFYRYYAIKGWYKRALEKDIDVENVLKDAEFMTKYDTIFEKTVVDICKKYSTPLTNVVFAKDCSRDKIWRTSLYPQYKASRDDRNNSFNGDIFKHTYNVLVPKLQAKYGFHTLYQNHLEADDLIAIFVSYMRGKGLGTVLTIITNDNDYVQLYKHNVNIYNLQHKSLRDRITDVDTYLQHKIIVGDKSDNIKSVGKKIGEKTAQKMIDDPATYNKIMSQPGVQEQYDLNKTLIDFDNIPPELVKEVRNQIDNMITI